MTKKPDTGSAIDDKETSALLALLYPDEGEPSGDSELGDDREFEDMLGLRSLFSSLPDEEPSDAVSNRLLALAAQHVPSPRVSKEEKPGVVAWIGEFLMSLTARPALAAMASLVLVAGVAGTIYMRGDMNVAEPTVASETSLQNGLSGDTPKLEKVSDLETSALTRSDTVGLRGGGEPAPASENAAPVPEEEGTVTDGAGDTAKLSPESKGKGRLEKKSTKSIPQKPTSKRNKVGGLLGSTTAGSTSTIRSGLDSPKEEQEEVATETPVVILKPAPPPPSSPSRDGDDLSPESLKDSVATNKVSGLHQQAKVAAKRGDCAKVLSIGRQIRKLDSSYYDRSFLADSSLVACQRRSSKKRATKK